MKPLKKCVCVPRMVAVLLSADWAILKEGQFSISFGPLVKMLANCRYVAVGSIPVI